MKCMFAKMYVFTKAKSVPSEIYPTAWVTEVVFKESAFMRPPLDMNEFYLFRGQNSAPPSGRLRKAILNFIKVGKSPIIISSIQ